MVEIPPGAAQVRFVMQADADLDLFAKFGSDIVEWDADGDWDVRDIDASPIATLTVDAPTAGAWYGEVVFANGGDAVASNTFEAQVR
ncbi:hypothetical protein BH23DEI1_BH23DEI1_24920 [soil metagenome]